MSTFYKVAIANRGEIAIRAIRACKELGIKPVLLYSVADKNSLAYRLCEETLCIGPGDPLQSYLNISRVINGAMSVGAKALYPGYGFLSERADLAIACENKGLIFIGPPAFCLKLFGNKVEARKKAQTLGIPTLPASYNPSLSSAQKIGFPVMIKALHGGGGRGLRIIFNESQWEEALFSAQREAKLAFGSSDIFIEKFLPNARHIEVQIFVDRSGQVHYLSNRDCSVQRKHQKIIEEAPALKLSTHQIRQMKDVATKLMESVSYLQAGTVEFLCHDLQFYFLEVNPRLQVECPVTEEVLGIDLVKAQMLTALKQFPFATKLPLTPKGHSIQCRIYAENVMEQVPIFGSLHTCEWPVGGAGRRVDMGYESEDMIPPFYDSMIGKIIVWDENRMRAIKRMEQTLKETIIFGVETNISFLQDLITHHAFVKSQIHTQFVEEVFLKNWKPKTKEDLDPDVLHTIYKNFPLLSSSVLSSDRKELFNPWKHFSSSK